MGLRTKLRQKLRAKLEKLKPRSFQNMNELPGDKHYEATGHPVMNGRAWWGDSDAKDKLHVQWCLGKHSKTCGADLHIDETEGEYTVSMRIPHVASLYLVRPIPKEWDPVVKAGRKGGSSYCDRTIGVNFNEWNLRGGTTPGQGGDSR